MCEAALDGLQAFDAKKEMADMRPVHKEADEE